MKKSFVNNLLIILLVLASTMPLFPQHHRSDDDRKTAVISDRTEELLNRIREKLDDLDAEYLTRLHPREYNKAKRELHKIYDLIEAIENQQVVEVDLPITAMPEEDYRQLVNSINNESFEENKLSVLSSSAKYNYFSVDQIIGLMDLSAFSTWKLRTLEITYPFVVDKNNSFKIINALTFSEDKEKARKIMDRN